MRLDRYIASQLAGAIFAALVLKLLSWDHATLGATLPAGSTLQAFTMETLRSYF